VVDNSSVWYDLSVLSKVGLGTEPEVLNGQCWRPVPGVKGRPKMDKEGGG
jgi:hypothetical protein